MVIKSIIGATCTCLAVLSFSANAALLTFTNESDYLSAISSSTAITEDFDTSPWFNAPFGGAVSVTSQGLIWSSSELIKTSNNWGRTNAGVYSSNTSDPDFIKVVSTIGTLYGVGGWIKGSSATDITFSLDSNEVFTTDIPNWGDPDVSFTVHEFFGVIDTDGFTTMSFAASSGDWGADDFTFATSPVSAVPIPAAVWLFCSGLIGLAGFAKRKA